MNDYRFRAIERTDLPILRDWRNALMRNFRQWRYLSLENQEAWFKAISSSNEHVMLAFEENHALLGVVGLTYINWQTRKAEVSIYIGPEHQGKGHGEVALAMLLDYGFKNLGLHRIFGEIFEFNQPNIELFTKLGFKLEGTMREAHFDDGRYWDTKIMAILEGEWKETSARLRVELPFTHGQR